MGSQLTAIFSHLIMKMSALLLAALLGTVSAKSLTIPSNLKDMMTSASKPPELLSSGSVCKVDGDEYKTFVKEMMSCTLSYFSACLGDMDTCSKVSDSAGKIDCSVADFAQEYATCMEKAHCDYASSQSGKCRETINSMLEQQFNPNCRVGPCPEPFPVIVIVIVLIILVLASIGFCYWKKVCCFKPKTANPVPAANAGGSM